MSFKIENSRRVAKSRPVWRSVWALLLMREIAYKARFLHNGEILCEKLCPRNLVGCINHRSILVAHIGTVWVLPV